MGRILRIALVVDKEWFAKQSRTQTWRLLADREVVTQALAALVLM